MLGGAYRSLPKVLLHDHLDGGVRPATVIELAARSGYADLPYTDEKRLADWFYQGDGSASLEEYLEAFSHTFGVMQEPAALEQVMHEAAEDFAADGVVYAEVRFGPSLHTRQGLSRKDVIAAVLAGVRRGEEDFGVVIRLIIDALRQDTDSLEVAEAALEFAGLGVVGFDLAGPETSFPATGHREACERAVAGGLRLTVHAGEGAGVDSIVTALEVGAERLGHGARLIEDTTVRDGEIVELGPVAKRVHDEGIPLELAPTSNLHTSMYPDAASHPIGALYRAGFAVTNHPDNRLMSRTSMSQEFALVAEHHGFGLGDLERVTCTALDAAFCDADTRDRVKDRVAAGYSAVS